MKSYGFDHLTVAVKINENMRALLCGIPKGNWPDYQNNGISKTKIKKNIERKIMLI